jgi:hypothetical protein
MDIHQPGNWVMRLRKLQDGVNIWGDADSGNGIQHQYGIVQSGGTLNGNNTDFTVGWRNGAIGHHAGEVDNNGFVVDAVATSERLGSVRSVRGLEGKGSAKSWGSWCDLRLSDTPRMPVE